MSREENQANSIKDRLSVLSRKLKVPFQNVMTEFLLERLVQRLTSSTELSDLLIFKGGYVNLRVYNSPRYTIDLDTLLKRGRLDQIGEKARLAAETSFDDGVWFRFEKTVDLETQGEYGGLRLVFRAGIGKVLSNLKKAQIIHLDIGKGDPVTPAPKDVQTPYILGDGSLSWKVYPVETTVAEKLHALTVRGEASSRSKDIFDLNLLIPQCQITDLKAAIKETFRYRGDELPDSIYKYIELIDRGMLRRGWRSAIGDGLGTQSFDETFDELVDRLRKFGI